MFETNSASCGGFPGISDSFGGALWALDYGLQVYYFHLKCSYYNLIRLQMAYSNFSGALLHVGGQNVFYNVSRAFIIFCECVLTLTAAVHWYVLHRLAR
jgi:hypothetical protein